MSDSGEDAVRTERLQALLDGASELAEDGDLETALLLLEEAPADLKPFGMFHYVRGALLVRSNRLDEAIDALQKGIAVEPDIPEMRSNLGAALLNRAQAHSAEGLQSVQAQTDLTHATEILSEAARMAPTLAEVHANHGRALHLSGRIPEALLAFERALLIDPNHIPTLYNQAAAFAAQGDDRKVMATLDLILHIDPSFEPAVVSRARAQARLAR